MRIRSVMFVVLLALGAAISVSAQSEQQPEDPRSLSYRMCEWGLITVEAPTELPAVTINIESPPITAPCRARSRCRALPPGCSKAM